METFDSIEVTVYFIVMNSGIKGILVKSASTFWPYGECHIPEKFRFHKKYFRFFPSDSYIFLSFSLNLMLDICYVLRDFREIPT